MNPFEPLAFRDREGRALGRHSLLLATLVFMMVALPMLEWSSGRTFRFPIFFSIVLMAAIWVHRAQRWILWTAIVGGIGAVGGNALAVALGSSMPRMVADVFGLALLVLTTFVMLNTITRPRHVELDTVVGGICVYLLTGSASRRSIAS